VATADRNAMEFEIVRGTKRYILALTSQVPVYRLAVSNLPRPTAHGADHSSLTRQHFAAYYELLKTRPEPVLLPYAPEDPDNTHSGVAGGVRPVYCPVAALTL
jgi:hypothetical protein